jgi:hypothetical protein
MLGNLHGHLTSLSGNVGQENAQLLEIQSLELANRKLESTVQELNRQINVLRKNNEIQKALAAKAIEEQAITARKLRHARRVIGDLLDERTVVKSLYFARQVKIKTFTLAQRLSKRRRLRAGTTANTYLRTRKRRLQRF